MNTCTIQRSSAADNFSIIQNTILCDKSISWKAKGILCYLLSKPKDWVVRVSDIVNQGSEGEAAIRAALKELRAMHYARLVQIRKAGQIIGWQLFVSDQPNLPAEAEKPDSENQHLGFQHLEKPDVENRHITNTEAITNTETNKILNGDFAFDETKRRKASISPTMPEIPSALNTPEFMTSWGEWLADRKERGKKVTSRAAKMQLTKLEAWGVKKAIEAIGLSITNNWSGIFEPKPQTKGVAPANAQVNRQRNPL